MERPAKYKKESLSLRDPVRIRQLRTAAKRRGMGHLTNASIIRMVVDEWCKAQETAK